MDIREDRRLIAQLAIQLLKDNEDLSGNGDLLTCLRHELKNPGDLPGCYRYHEDRIYEMTKLAEKILTFVDASIGGKKNGQESKGSGPEV